MVTAFGGWLGRSSLCGSDSVVLAEHPVGRRIADLVVARVDPAAATIRVRAGLRRQLSPEELHVVRTTQVATPMRLSTLGERAGLDLTTTRRIADRLAAEGYLVRRANGSLSRSCEFTCPVSDVVTFEIKRDRWKDAFHQARAHSQYARAAYVVFDAAYRRRFVARRAEFSRQGIGLLAFEATTKAVTLEGRPRYKRVSGSFHAALAAEEAWGRLLGGVPSRLPQANLRGVAVPSGDLAPRLLERPPRIDGQLRVGPLRSQLAQLGLAVR